MSSMAGFARRQRPRQATSWIPAFAGMTAILERDHAARICIPAFAAMTAQ